MYEYLTGKFLIASPYLPDDNFMRSVIYVVRHDEEGAFGLTLTRPSELRLSSVMESAMGSKPLRDDPIYLGGPVEGPLCALHDDANLADLDCIDGLCVTSEQESLTVLANSPGVRVRFFAGYSGWGPGQLEAEMQRGGWLSCDATNEEVFGDPDSLWEHVVKRVGTSIIQEVFPTAGGADPQLN